MLNSKEKGEKTISKNLSNWKFEKKGEKSIFCKAEMKKGEKLHFVKKKKGEKTQQQSWWEKEKGEKIVFWKKTEKKGEKRQKFQSNW